MLPKLRSAITASAAERLLDDGADLAHARKCGCVECRKVPGEWGPQKVALVEMVWRARSSHPALLFRAMFEGWSCTRIRFELGKLGGT